MPEEIQYHQSRAARELDLGLSASNLNAARAHLKLSSLHMQRARELGATDPRPPLQM